MFKKVKENMLLLVGLAVLAATACATGSYSHWDMFIKNVAGFGVQTGTARVTIKSDGTNDILSGQNSSGTEVFDVKADGDLTAVDGGFSGNVTVTGTFAPTGAATFSGMVTVNDNLLVDGDGVEALHAGRTGGGLYERRYLAGFHECVGVGDFQLVRIFEPEFGHHLGLWFFILDHLDQGFGIDVLFLGHSFLLYEMRLCSMIDL